jgi:hypothetical protein
MKGPNLPKQRCPNCRRRVNTASPGPTGKQQPSPGDMAVCFYCHHLMVFADDMTMRDLTDAEVVEVAGHPSVVITMEALGEFKRKP